MTDTPFTTLGKDSPVQETIHRFQAALAHAGFEVEVASELNPVPHVYSLHLRLKHYPRIYTNGKGSTRDAALASALGEFHERLATQYFFSDYYAPSEASPFLHHPSEKYFDFSGKKMPKGLLTKELYNAYTNERVLPVEMLSDPNSGDLSRGICALPFVRQRDKKEIYFPTAVLANLYASNGMAAGNTKWECRTQALSEIIERFVRRAVFLEEFALPDIPQSVLKKYPAVTEAIAALEAHGYSVLAKDASLGGRYPAICIILLNPKNGTCFASFGAHPSFAVALERTMTELLQGRSLDMLDGFHPPTFDYELACDPQNLEAHFVNADGYLPWSMLATTFDFDFVEWDFSQANNELNTQKLLSIFDEMDMDVYIADYSFLGVDTCRILIPFASEIYPMPDLMTRSTVHGAMLRTTLLSLHEQGVEDLFPIIEHMLDASLHSDIDSASGLLGLIPDEGSIWETLTVGEVLFFYSLYVNGYRTETNEETAKDMTSIEKYDKPFFDEEDDDFEFEGEYPAALDALRNRVLYGGRPSPQWATRYRCFEALLADETPQNPANLSVLNTLYGKEVVNWCRRLLPGGKLPEELTWLSNKTKFRKHFTAHHTMLQLRNQLHAIIAPATKIRKLRK